MENSFIKQTAEDYDITYNEVKNIYEKYPANPVLFYEKLEEFIKERANQNKPTRI